MSVELESKLRKRAQEAADRMNAAYDHYGMGNTPETARPLDIEAADTLRRYREALEAIANDRYSFNSLEPLIERLHKWQETSRQALQVPHD